jgi:hypothetical protein
MIGNGPGPLDGTPAFGIQEHDRGRPAVADGGVKIALGIDQGAESGGPVDHQVAHEGLALLQSADHSPGQHPGAEVAGRHPGRPGHPAQRPAPEVGPDPAE